MGRGREPPRGRPVFAYDIGRGSVDAARTHNGVTMPQPSEEAPAAPPAAPTPPRITPAQWALLLVLAAVNFTHIVDFVIMMPLGPRYQHDLKIELHDFGRLVETYGYAAAASGLLAAFLVDRFDRKRALLVLYAGLVLGTL